MLYKKNSEKVLSKELFKNPTSEYRCTPFWAWNCKLEQGLLNREIDTMKEMGMGGYFMHSRTGSRAASLSGTNALDGNGTSLVRVLFSFSIRHHSLSEF